MISHLKNDTAKTLSKVQAVQLVQKNLGKEHKGNTHTHKHTHMSREGGRKPTMLCVFIKCLIYNKTTVNILAFPKANIPELHLCM